MRYPSDRANLWHNLVSIPFPPDHPPTPPTPVIWIHGNTWLYEVLPEEIVCGKAVSKAGAAACSTGQDDK